MYPRQSPTTHTEQLGAEASVYDWARGRVHALNPTAARVWRQCDGGTSPEAIAAVLRVELGIPEAEAVVDLTLAQLARVHLLEMPVESRSDRSKTTRRWLISRGVTAALLPAIYSIVAPSPLEAQSVGAGAPTLTSLSPNQGVLGSTVTVTVAGTNFVAGATTVTVNSGGVTASNVIVSSATSLTVDIVIAANATAGAHTVTVTTAGGTTAAQTFTVGAAPTPAPTLTSIAPTQGLRGATVAVTLTGTNFIVGATTVTIGGGSDITVNTVVVGSSTSLTANFVLALSSLGGPRTVTVTTAGGTSGPQTFTITLPASGSTAFSFTGSAQTFTVPAGVNALTVIAEGAQGGGAAATALNGGLGGRVTATLAVIPGDVLNVFVGGQGGLGQPLAAAPGGFNGGAAGGFGSFGIAGAGGGASDIRSGGTALSNRVVVAGGGGGGAVSGLGTGGAGGGPGGNGANGANGSQLPTVTGGGGGTQAAGGSGGTNPSSILANGLPGASGTGGAGGPGPVAGSSGGGGGGGYFGGGGGAAGNSGQLDGGSGGGGSSLDAPGVVHAAGIKTGDGAVTISW